MRNYILIFALLFSTQLFSQNSPTKIEVAKIIYSSSFDSDTETLYKVENIVVEDTIKVRKLYGELSHKDERTLLSQFGIDTILIENNPEKFLAFYDDKNNFEWNKEQRSFILKELSRISNYEEILEDYLNNGCCYSMHNRYRSQFIIKVYSNSQLLNEYKSRKFAWSYQFPWIDNFGNKIYNYRIEKLVNIIFNEKSKNKEPLNGQKLLNYLVNKIIDSNINKLYSLAANSYINEINELKSHFTINSFEEVYGSGRYGRWDNKTLKISLHNERMLPNVNIQFLPEVFGKKLYTRDFLLLKNKEIVERVQDINFIKEYLSLNSESILDIYFFNNKPINDYNIDAINKNPVEWQKQDVYIKSLDFYSKYNIKPSFDLKEAIKTSERLHCGCNYRFEKSFIDEAIFFEISDKNKNSSVWFLLPDDRVLLYLSQGEKILSFDYTKFGKYPGVQTPCVLFDINGTIINLD